MSLAEQLKPTVSQLRPMFDYVKKQRENEKFMRSIELGATFFLITFFLIFAIKPTAVAISSLLGDISSKQIMVKELKTKINNIILAQDAYAQIQEKYSIINASLPDSPEYYQAANQIAGIFAGLNLPPQKFSYILNSETNKNTVLPSNIGTYSISIPVDSDFIRSKSLVASILNNRRATDLPIVSFTTEETDTGSAKKLNFTATFYYWNQQK